MNKEILLEIIDFILEDIKNDRIIQATEKLFELKLKLKLEED